MITAPIVDLGGDVQICQNDVVILDADSNAVTYQWSTGAITPSIIVTLPGNYSVAATNECGTTTDQVNVSVIPSPVLELGNNFGVCPGEAVTLDTNIPNATYVWSTGDTTESISVNAPGTYWVNVTTTCGVLSDQVFAYDGAIDLNAGDDVQLCSGETATLMATGANEYVWSNGLTGSIIEVSPEQTTTYSVTATNVYGCSATDEVVVNVNAAPEVPTISIAGTATFCSNEPSTLSIDPVTGAQYQWLRNNLILSNATEPVYTPQQSGTFTIQLTNAAGCSSTSQPVEITVLPAFEETIVLQAENGTANYNGDVLMPGVYQYLYETIAGCDSLYIVQVVDSGIIGCVIESACNYNPIAGTADNSLCLFPDCADELACNYNANANCPDSTLCVYATPYYDCTGSCISDNDSDGVCDELEVVGCTDVLACNYNELATEADSSCAYAEQYFDCLGGCLNDTDADGVCDELEISGCADSLACNYDTAVTEDDSSCVYAETYYDCSGLCLNDTDNDGVCDELESEGCTDSLACNFNPTVLSDDGSCIYPGCTDSLACNYNLLAGCDDGSCVLPDACGSCEGISGCTDVLACNYDSLATCDDSSCFWLPTFAILGLDSVLMDSLAVYTYVDQPGSNYMWTVTGGTIIGQADTSIVFVNWGAAGVGEVCVIETQDSCAGQQVCLQVTISDPAAIAEWTQGDWTLYPNPSSGVFRLLTRDASLRSYDVYDALGQHVHSGALQGVSTEIDLSSWAAGHYLIRCGSAYKRMVIVR